MHKPVVLALLALFAGCAAAQPPPRPDAAAPSARSASPAYASAFERYRPFAEAEAGRWREANDEMGKLGGHVGHAPQSMPSRGSAPQPAKLPANSGHGERK